MSTYPKMLADRFTLQAKAANISPHRLLLDEFTSLQQAYFAALKLLLEEKPNEDCNSRRSSK
jgi:hypothetical protein